MKKLFRVPVEWMVCDFVEVEAESFLDAVKCVLEHRDEIPLGTEPEYIDGTYQINSEDAVTGNPGDESYAKNVTEMLESFGYGKPKAAYIETNADCPVCGSKLVASDDGGKLLNCLECGNILSYVSDTQVDGDNFLIFIDVPKEEYIEKKEALKDMADCYDCNILQYSDNINRIEIGWIAEFEAGKMVKPTIKVINELAKRLAELF